MNQRYSKDSTFAECHIKHCGYIGHQDTFITNNQGTMLCPKCNGNATRPVMNTPRGCLLVGEDELLERTNALA